MGGSVPCAACGRALEVPPGAKPGDTIDCPTCAGVSLGLSRHGGEWRGALTRRASCAAGEEEVILADEVQPGDIIECHGVKQRVTYEYGAWALERA